MLGNEPEQPDPPVDSVPACIVWQLLSSCRFLVSADCLGAGGASQLHSVARARPIENPLEVPMKFGSFLATLFLGVVSLAHLFRLIFRLNVQIGHFPVPQWMSFIAFLFCGALAVSLYIEARGK